MRSTLSPRQVIERTRTSRKTEIREERLLKKSIGSLFSFYLNEADEKERFKPLNELKQGLDPCGQNCGRMRQQNTGTRKLVNITKRQNLSKSVLAATHLIVLV